MLPTYPDLLLDYAVDGVIQAASLAHADDARRLHAFARKAAADVRAEAAREADTLRAAAATEGYHDGLLKALQAALPLIDALGHEQVALSEAVSRDTHAALRAAAASPQVAIELVCAAFADHRATAAGQTAVLHVPAQDLPLQAALAGEPRLAGLQIRPAARSRPLLEIGCLAWELDASGALADDVVAALDARLPGVAEALGRLADDYAARVVATLRDAGQRDGFNKTRKTP